MASRKVLKKKKVVKNGSPYWVVLEDRDGSTYVVGYYEEWQINDESHSGENLGYDFDAVVKSFNSQSKEDKKSKKKSSETSSSSDDDDSMGFCAKFLCTIILVLPIWWIMKAFVLTGWSFLKAIYYIVSWPVRLILCCYCNTELIPEGTFKFPEYDFSTH